MAQTPEISSFWQRNWKVFLVVFIVVAVIIIMCILSAWLLIKQLSKSPNQAENNLPAGSTTSSQATVVPPGNSAENIENLAIIIDILKKENLSPSWIDSQCIFAYTSSETAYQAVEIREDHQSESCQAGDPNVSPRVDSFKLKDGALEWLDSLSGQYVSLNEYRKYLDSLPKI